MRGGEARHYPTSKTDRQVVAKGKREVGMDDKKNSVQYLLDLRMWEAGKQVTTLPERQTGVDVGKMQARRERR